MTESIPEEPKNAAQASPDEMGETGQKQAGQQSKRLKEIPDWRPLGTIRDYFSEQIKQDRFY